MNLINIFSKELSLREIMIFTTQPKTEYLYSSSSPHIKIWRLPFDSNENIFKRMLGYMYFNLRLAYYFFLRRPADILYFETISAFVPCLYRIWMNRKSSIYIHYHEYMAPKDYRNGMVLGRLFHALEKKIYKYAKWISHTNSRRMDLFARDIGQLIPNKHVLPNFPPAAWRKYQDQVGAVKENRIGFVYVGSLDSVNMYLREAADLIAAEPEKYFWDIFSDNISEGALRFISTLGAENIKFRGPASYFELPRILLGYQVGLILYKGHSDNYIYNLPNKLFEYHVCGLDVWFPKELKGSAELVTNGTYPRIVEVDYQNLSKHFDKYLSRQGLTHSVLDCTAEAACHELVRALNFK